MKPTLEMPKEMRQDIKELLRSIPSTYQCHQENSKTSNRNYEFNIHGCRSGLLDEAKIAEAYQGVPQVYIRKGKVETSNSAVVVLIDESGSMGGGRHYYSKVEMAKELQS